MVEKTSALASQAPSDHSDLSLRPEAVIPAQEEAAFVSLLTFRHHPRQVVPTPGDPSSFLSPFFVFRSRSIISTQFFYLPLSEG